MRQVYLVSLVAFFVVGVAPAGAQTTLHHDESVDGDLSQSPPGPSFDMVVGVNEWRGRIEATAPAQNDYFTAVLPDGLAITRIQATGPADDGGSSFTGFIQVSGGSVFESSRTGSIDATYSPAVTPGSLEVVISTNFNISNKPWTVQITVEGDSGCVPEAEVCSDAIDNDCDDAVDCDDDDCAADPICAPPLYDQLSSVSGPSNIRSHTGFSQNEDAEAADDFDVPTNVLNWEVDGVTARMPLPPTVNMNVVFRHDAGGTVGSDVSGCVYTNLTSANFTVVDEQVFSRRIEVTLPQVCTLMPGTYWVTVQANGGATPLFNWESGPEEFGANARFRSNAVLPDCNTGEWFDASACTTSQLISNPDNANSLHFAIHGTATPGSGAVCGNNVTEEGEECDDGNTDDGDCCSFDCLYEPAGTACGDASDGPCDNPDTCDGAGNCEANNEPDGFLCDDGDDCSTVDACIAGVCEGGPDETEPEVDCAAIDPVRSADEDMCGFTMPGVGFDAVASDNCTGEVLVNDYNDGTTLAGATFPVGTTSVTWTVTDAVGLADSCTVEIVIADDQPPTLDCPDDVEADATSPDGAVVSYEPPAAVDNCSDATVECLPPSGELFDIGMTAVTCTATDAGGSTATCAFMVTVLSPEEIVEKIMDAIDDLEDDGVVNGGQGNALAQKLAQVLRSLDRNRINAACNVLNAFMNQIDALLAAGILTPKEAQPLFDSAGNARAALGCDPGAGEAAMKGRGALRSE